MHRLAQWGQRIWLFGVLRVVQSSWREKKEEAMREGWSGRQAEERKRPLRHKDFGIHPEGMRSTVVF